ncbi:hypothetical protein EOI86_21600 [Hwanghaeella grinnelliae]|uniref:Uncharacterized protein n=1 Tax=Hwanghaeella grinnelliae TaxID=2500179 RepID=A0A3S2XZY3_9PROT|nr:hypothetical protein [Hwanghaeella grinnelliae]RVU33743.1 hypothetical protein EOI86_21600 [Hwanghaeella grinnelliae]
MSERLWKLGRALVTDLAVAVLCLVLLSALFAAVMPGIGAAVERFFPGNSFVDWRAAMNDFRREWWKDGLAVSMMLFTTLWPTAVHFALGSFAAIMPPPEARRLLIYAFRGRVADVDRFIFANIAVGLVVAICFVGFVTAGARLLSVWEQAGWLFVELPYLVSDAVMNTLYPRP